MRSSESGVEGALGFDAFGSGEGTGSLAAASWGGVDTAGSLPESDPDGV